MKIKKIIKLIVKYLIRALSFFFTYSTMLRLRNFKITLFTNWIATEFKILGENSSIGYPIVLKGGKYISIGNNTGLGARGTLAAWDFYAGDTFSPIILIGNNTSIGEDYHITAINQIQIGNNVLMGKKITITDNAHGKADLESIFNPPLKRALETKGPVIIEDGVWIGDKVTILPNVTIGRNSIIGANALVSKDIPANCVAGGVPARVIKEIT